MSNAKLQYHSVWRNRNEYFLVGLVDGIFLFTYLFKKIVLHCRLTKKQYQHCGCLCIFATLFFQTVPVHVSVAVCKTAKSYHWDLNEMNSNENPKIFFIAHSFLCSFWKPHITLIYIFLPSQRTCKFEVGHFISWFCFAFCIC